MQMNSIIIGSGNGLPPNQRQAITCASDQLLWLNPEEENSVKAWNKMRMFLCIS